MKSGGESICVNLNCDDSGRSGSRPGKDPIELVPELPPRVTVAAWFTKAISWRLHKIQKKNFQSAA